tara:strand:- start:59 stop:718 length:660 start_codon:yes stop_codon:yes gene_type:complete
MPEVNTTGGAFPEETTSFNEQDQAILEGRDPNEAQQQEELIGGKFKSADDLLDAYQELQKKLGERSQETPELEDTQYESDDQDVEAGDVVGGVEQVPLSEQEEGVILEIIGGEEGLDAMADWATQNLDQDEIQAYNQEVNSGDFTRARNALQSMFFAMQQAQGQEPELMGGRISANSGDVFRSVQEVEAAMNDPRYLNDTAYTKDVEEKMSRSDVLTPR